MLDRVDTAALRRRHPLPDLLARCGVTLRRYGRALVGRCPFHDDQGRPNLYVYPDDGRWRCYRCGAGGDAIAFVQRRQGLDFLAAVRRLEGGGLPDRGANAIAPTPFRLAVRRRPAPERCIGPEERACLEVATACYHRRLLAKPAALAYLAARGVAPSTIAACRLGFAVGGDLAPALRRRGLSLAAAARAGLVARGRERLAGRLVIPELRAGRPIWAIGRRLGADASPKYLALPGPRPLLGRDAVRPAPRVLVVEGAFDWLALRQWGYPAAALLGTHPSAEALAVLRRVPRVDLLLDGDAAGRDAASRLAQALGPPARILTLPGVEDVGELARRPDGRATFAAWYGDYPDAVAA